MTVRVVTPYGPGAASARTRVFAWLDRAGISAEVLDYAGTRSARIGVLGRHPVRIMQAERQLRRAGRQPVDTLLMHVRASPLSRGGVEADLLRGAGHAVLDVDDGVQWDWRTGPMALLRSPTSFLRAVRAADVVIAGNDTIGQWAAEHAHHVEVIPTCIDPFDYDAKSTYDIAGRPRVAWLGSPSAEWFLGLISSALLELHRRTGARLVVISRGERSLGPLEKMVTRVPWTLAVQRGIGQFADVGLMPLDDTLWSRCKCGYKLLQYAAAGVPAVASPAGVNRPIAESLGFPLAATPEEWLAAIEQLLALSDDDRRIAGQTARKLVTERYSYAAWMDTWRAAVLGQPAAAPVTAEGGPDDRIA
jgi:glycosyltransferase involved in cell wall biosynthesis